MKREILFRGKTEQGDWAFGDLIQDEQGWVCILPIEEQKICLDNCIEVIPETVGQFTGITDKNGTKIFDGDKVYFEIKGLGESESECYFSYGCYFLKVSGQDSPFPLFQAEFRTDIGLEVIGNINLK